MKCPGMPIPTGLGCSLISCVILLLMDIVIITGDVKKVRTAKKRIKVVNNYKLSKMKDFY